MIGQLPNDPSKSRLALARLEDDELAEASLAEVDGRASSGPSLADWSPEAAYTVAVVDRLGELISALIAAHGGKPPKVRPLPRPRTAFDRARWKRSQERHQSLVAEVNAAREKAKR